MQHGDQLVDVRVAALSEAHVDGKMVPFHSELLHGIGTDKVIEHGIHESPL